MAKQTPDRTEIIRGRRVKHMDVGGARRVFVAADGTPGSATLAHLVIKETAHQLSTGLSNLQIFGNETAARAAYPEIDAAPQLEAEAKAKRLKTKQTGPQGAETAPRPAP